MRANRINRIIQTFVTLVGLAMVPERMCAVTLFPGDIVVSDPNGLGLGAIFKVDPITGAQTTVSSDGLFTTGGGGPRGITIDAMGEILVADPNALGGGCPVGCGGIIKVNPVTGGQTVVSSGGLFVNPWGLTLDPIGDIIVADETAFGATIFRVNPITGSQTVISSGGSMDAPYDLAIAANGDIIVSDPLGLGVGAIFRINPISGAQTTISSGGFFTTGGGGPRGLALDGNGDILVADPNALGGGCPVGCGAIIKVDPVTGAQTVVSSGGMFVNPWGLAIEANGDIVVADETAFGATLFRVDPVTGSQSIISSGGGFVDPYDVAIVQVPEPSTISLAICSLLVLRRTQSGRPTKR